jgi:RNA-dependent RNA polymerase
MCVLGFPQGSPCLKKSCAVAHHDGKGSPPDDKCLTDGCHLVSYSVLASIRQQVGLAEVPTAVQGRVAGSKGLFIRKPYDNDADGPLKVWIRASGHKIKLGDLTKVDRAQRIFDLVAPARVTHPARLSTQLLLNYSSNGVPNKVLLRCFADTVCADIEPLMHFDGLYWRELLVSALSRAGNVAGTRLQRLAGAEGRARGVVGRFGGEQADEVDVDAAEDARDAAERALGKRDRDEGPPASAFEKALRMLEAGFTPLEEPYLHELMRSAVKTTLNSLLDKYHVVMPRSAEMFIIPGTLVSCPLPVFLTRRRSDGDAEAEGDLCSYVTRSEGSYDGCRNERHSWRRTRASLLFSL